MGKKRVIKQTKESLLKEVETSTSLSKKAEKLPKISKKLFKAKIYIKSTYNNTIIALTDLKGNMITWSSAGLLGYRGTKKSTPFVASKIAGVIAEKAKRLGINEFLVFVKGVGAGREGALRSLISHGLNVVLIKDITPIPHNGCRPRKPRRV